MTRTDGLFRNSGHNGARWQAGRGSRPFGPANASNATGILPRILRGGFFAVSTMLADGWVRLRPYAEDERDIEAACRWYSDPDVLENSEGRGTPPFDRGRVIRMYRHLASKGELYIIDVQENDGWVPIGDVTLASDTLPIVIGESRWRSCGIGSRVLALLISRARALGWTQLRVKHIYDYNVRSQALFVKFGFAEIGHVMEADGTMGKSYALQL